MFSPKTGLLASVSLSLFLCTTTFASPVRLEASKRFDSAPGESGAALDRIDDATPGVHNLDSFVVNPPRLTRRQDVYDEIRGHRSAGSSPKDRKRGQPHFNDQGDSPPGGDGPPQEHGPPEGDNPPQGHGPPGPLMKRNLFEKEQSVAPASDPHHLSHPIHLVDLKERDFESDQDNFFDDDDDDEDHEEGLEKRDVEDDDVVMPDFGKAAPDPKMPTHPHRPPRSVELQEKREVKDDSSDDPGPGGAPGWNGNPAPDPVFPKPPKHPHRPPGPIVLYERDEVFDPPYARYTPQERAAQPASHLERRNSEQERKIDSEALHWSWAPWGDKGTPLYHGAEPRPHIPPHGKGLERRDPELMLSDDEEGEGRRDGPTLARRYRPSGGYVPPEGGPDEQPPTSATHGTSDADGPPLARRAYYPGPGNEPWASTGESGGSGSSRSGDGGPSRRSLVNENGVRFVSARRSEQQSVNDIHLDSVPTDHHVPALARRRHAPGPPPNGPNDQPPNTGSHGKGGPPRSHYINENDVRFVGAKRSEHESISRRDHLQYPPVPHPPPGDDDSGWESFRQGQVNEHSARYVGTKRSVKAEESVDERHLGRRSSLPGDDGGVLESVSEESIGERQVGKRSSLPGDDGGVLESASEESVDKRHLGRRSSLPGDNGGVLEDVSEQSQKSRDWKVSDPYHRGCTKDDHCNGRPGQVMFAKRDGVDHEGDLAPAALHYPVQRVTDLNSETRDLNAKLKQNPQQSQSALDDTMSPNYVSLVSPSIYITSSLEHQPSSALGFYGICRCDRFPDDGKLDGQSSSAIGSCVSKFVEIASKTAKCKFSTISEVDCVEVGGKDQMTEGDNVWWQQAFCKRCVDAGGVSDASFKCPAGYTSDGKVDTSDGVGSTGMGQRDEGGVESEKRSSEKQSGLVPGSGQLAVQSHTNPEQQPGAQQ